MRKPASVPGVLAILIATLALFTTPAFAAPGAVADAGQKGPYQVGFTYFMLTDASRPGDGSTYAHRPIPVYVWYPVDPATISASTPEASYPMDPLYHQVPPFPASLWTQYGVDKAYQEPAPSKSGPFPVVVLSPGFGGSAWFHLPVAARLASHGIVVAVPYHAGDQFWPWEPPYDNVAVASYNRPRDMSFVLTDLLTRNQTAGNLLAGTIDADQVIASGWSLGGYGAITLAAGDDSVCDTLYGFDVTDPPAWTCAPSPPDPRFKAIIPLDGSGWILHFNELSRVTVPALGLSQEWSGLLAQVEAGAIPAGFEAWAARQHAAYSGHPAYRVEIVNSFHWTFGDVCDGYDLLVQQGVIPAAAIQPLVDAYCTPYISGAVANPIISKYMIAFIKTEIEHVTGYQALMTPGYALTQEAGLVEFFVTEKRSPQSISQDWPNDFIYFVHQPGSTEARAAKEPAQRMAVPRFSVPH